MQKPGNVDQQMQPGAAGANEVGGGANAGLLRKIQWHE
jgi:hypothetical protein